MTQAQESGWVEAPYECSAREFCESEKALRAKLPHLEVTIRHKTSWTFQGRRGYIIEYTAKAVPRQTIEPKR